MGDYRKLLVWNKSMDLTVMVYRMTEKLPKSEMYALADQMKRAAVSIPSNISEGQARISEKEFHHFLLIARGSAAELETQLELCVRLGYVKQEDIAEIFSLLHEIQRMIIALAGKVR